jgi:hypothetical protein
MGINAPASAVMRVSLDGTTTSTTSNSTAREEDVDRESHATDETIPTITTSPSSVGDEFVSCVVGQADADIRNSRTTISDSDHDDTREKKRNWTLTTRPFKSDTPIVGGIPQFIWHVVDNHLPLSYVHYLIAVLREMPSQAAEQPMG